MTSPGGNFILQLLAMTLQLILTHLWQLFWLTNKTSAQGRAFVDEWCVGTASLAVFIQSPVGDPAPLTWLEPQLPEAPAKQLKGLPGVGKWLHTLFHFCINAHARVCARVAALWPRVRCWNPPAGAPARRLGPACSGEAAAGGSLLSVGGCQGVWLMTPVKHAQAH